MAEIAFTGSFRSPAKAARREEGRQSSPLVSPGWPDSDRGSELRDRCLFRGRFSVTICFCSAVVRRPEMREQHPWSDLDADNKCLEHSERVHRYRTALPPRFLSPLQSGQAWPSLAHRELVGLCPGSCV